MKAALAIRVAPRRARARHERLPGPLLGVRSALFLILAASAGHARASTLSVEARARAALVRVALVYEGSAVARSSGFLVAPSGDLLVSRHAIAPALADRRFELTFESFDGAATGDWRLRSCAPSADVCALRVPDLVALGRERGLALRDRPARSGETLTAFGFADGAVRSSALGRALRTGADGDFAISAAIGPGMSGGPVLDLAGRAVGVVSRARRARSIAYAASSLAAARALRGGGRADVEVGPSTPRSLPIGNSILAVSLPRELERCRPLPGATDGIACSTSDGSVVFTVQRRARPDGGRVRDLKGVQIVADRLWPGAEPLAAGVDASPLTARSTPASCETWRDLSARRAFAGSEACAFDVFHDREFGARSRSVWTERGGFLFGFQIWAADSAAFEAYARWARSAARGAALDR